MAQFDDIPIHQLHKADGYQLRNIDDEEQSQGGIGFGEGEGEEDLKNVSLKDRVFSPKWKIRMAAFKAINQLFLDFDQNKERKKEDEMYGDPENPFDTYGPILEQMIKDTNLTAQYEGLICLFTYVKLGKDIKSVTFACHSYLLDKIQHNKPNLKDITQRILQIMLKRGENIIPEILKRFKSKNSKAICFCLGILLQAINEGSVSIQDINLKMVFKSTHSLLGHQNKEIREDALHIMFYVYENCEDDLNTFVSNLKNLRPVQIKELKDQLQSIEKNQESEYLIKLFDKASVNDGKKEGNPERSPQPRSKSTESTRARSDQRPEKAEEESEEQVDLINLLPENFNEIPYLSQINIKRKSMEALNSELEQLVAK